MKSPFRSAARLGAALSVASLVTGAAGLAGGPAAAGESKIAVVDVQHAVMATEDGIRAQATLKKMMAVISRLAKKNGYELVLDKQAAPYVRQDLDLTEQVIQMYNGGGADPGDSGGAEEKKPDGK